VIKSIAVPRQSLIECQAWHKLKFDLKNMRFKRFLTHLLWKNYGNIMSSKVYCLAQFQPKSGKEAELFKVLQSLESNTLREDGCIQYRVTRQIPNRFAEGKSLSIVFNEIWKDMAAFEAHCQRKEIIDFFETYCLAETGLAAEWNVCVYSDQPQNYDAPLLTS